MSKKFGEKPLLSWNVSFERQLTFEPALPGMKPSRVPVLRHTVHKGDTMASIFQRHNFPVQSAAQLEGELKKLFDKQQNKTPLLKKGQVIQFKLAPNGLLQEIHSSLSAGNELKAVRKQDGLFVASIRSLPKEQKDRVVLGVIESSFAGACADAGVPYDLVDDLVDLFSSKIAFHKDFQKGDRFTIIFRDHSLEDGTIVQAGPILAAAIETGGKEYYAARYVGTDGKSRYFGKDGKLLDSGFLRYPARFSRISSPFSQSRFHPVLRMLRPHNGVDFAAPVGTPVRTVADGKVSVAGTKAGSGIMVKVDHSDRYATAYMHLSRIEKGIRPGAMITRGQIIGAVGCTGLCTGPHLHYSFYDNGKYVDPLKMQLPTIEPLNKGNRIDEQYLKRVMFTLLHYQKLNLSNSWG